MGSSAVVRESDKARQDLRKRHPELFGQQTKVQNRDIAFPSLDAADKGPVQLARIGELGLRQFSVGPQVANAVADVPQK